MGAATTGTTEEATVTNEGAIRAQGVTRSDIAGAIDAVGADFVVLLRSLPGDAGSTPVPHLEWTVGETAAHMVTTLRRALGDNRRAASHADLAVLNATAVAELDVREPAALADLLEADLAALASVLPVVPDDLIVDLHAGVRSDLTTGASYFLADLLVHGFDIAVATGRPWTIDPGQAELALRAVLPTVRPWIKPEVLGGPARSAVLRFATSDRPIALEVGDGRFAAVIEESHAASTSHERVDPVTMMLAFTGRRPAPASIAEVCDWFLPI